MSKKALITIGDQIVTFFLKKRMSREKVCTADRHHKFEQFIFLSLWVIQ